MEDQSKRRAKQGRPTKVFVGLSGGVDSAVSAALLKKADYDITGVFIKVWQPDWIECTWKEERRDAMRVAAHLGIPFITLDLEKEYKRGVIDYMIAEYKVGRTPNPDVMCNREVKFGAFWRWAKKQGADYIATGHYARVTNPPAGYASRPLLQRGTPANNVKRYATNPPYKGGATRDSAGGGFVNNDFKLLMGLDPNKDQSYFLWTLNQKDLKHVLFPVGHLIKPEVRKLAMKFKLPNAEKKDSQGLCFIGKVDIKEFLAHYIKAKKGNVLNEKGEVIGTHPGALLFTIGERHGFTITEKSNNDKPHYVIAKNVKRNTITVSNKSRNDLLPSAVKKIVISHANWVNERPKIGSTLQARGRYRQALEDIKIAATRRSQVTIEFKRPQDTLTPGQSLVIYNNEECVGGGIIENP